MKAALGGTVAAFAACLLLTGCHTPQRYSQKQEYKFVPLVWGDQGSPDTKLNELAQQGWTIKESSISYTPHAYTGLFLFNRPVQ